MSHGAQPRFLISALVSGAWDGLNHSSPEPCGTAAFFSPVREVGDCHVSSGPTRCLFSLTFKQLQPSQHLHDCFVIITVIVVIIIIITTSDFLNANQAPVIKLEPRCKDGGRLSILRELPRPVGKARFRHQGQAARDDRWNKEETQEPPPQPRNPHHRPDLHDCQAPDSGFEGVSPKRVAEANFSLGSAPQAAQGRGHSQSPGVHGFFSRGSPAASSNIMKSLPPPGLF
ncbi:PREDICTED: uncharacterized protein LOC105587108 [Cercocebus atys]|uniref:uncharacterized protein LOC105587108 n=1 Tax=Cercocebus atys TaxID=9531 RepID=UPI0005F3DC27|nr:PREDICTED: uncharacterized protein LOC105587108 [Cercocebus atys]